MTEGCPAIRPNQKREKKKEKDARLDWLMWTERDGNPERVSGHAVRTQDGGQGDQLIPISVWEREKK